MCGRFVQDDELNTLLTTFALHGHRFPDYQPRWNIAPTQTIALIREHRHPDTEPRRLLGPARWSLVPPWEKTLPLRYSTINARSETIGHTRAFRGALGHHRALIPTGGYYEWATTNGHKVPHFVTASDTEGLAFASVYSWWQADEDTPPICTTTILTTSAPDHLSWVHDRTPVFVPPDHVDTWLDPLQSGDQDMVDDLISAQVSVTRHLSAVQVGPVTGDGPHLITAVNG
jgi:putative SOS response-associated peptidase YedK